MWTGLWLSHVWLAPLFGRDGWRPAARWPGWHPPQRASFSRSYARVVRAAPPDALLFFTVGRYVEFYGPQRLLAQQLLGLRAAFLPRAGHAFVAGFPAWHTGRFVRRALKRCPCVVLGRQSGGTSRATLIVGARDLGARGLFATPS